MFQQIDVKQWNQNVFSAIGDQWMLITAGTKDRCNTMTASWGGLGVLWGKPVATAYIRPQRYTKEFVDAQDCFTLSFFGEEHRKALALCGAKSGREIDKAAQCGFTVAESACGAPYFEEAQLVLVCRKLYVDTIKPECFLDRECDTRWYPEHDYHTVYIGAITEALQNCKETAVR